MEFKIRNYLGTCMRVACVSQFDFYDNRRDDLNYFSSSK